jgi:hypothetical protein
MRRPAARRTLPLPLPPGTGGLRPQYHAAGAFGVTVSALGV